MSRCCLTLAIAAATCFPAAIVTAGGKHVPQHIREEFHTVDEAADRAAELLQTDDYKFHSAIVYRAQTANGRPASGAAELHNIGRSAGYVPGSFESDEIYLFMKRTYRNRAAVELQLKVPGFEQLRRKVILRSGEINVWDDLVLKPLTKTTAATIYGSIWLEGGDDDLEDIIVYVDRSPVGFTDRDGYFKIDDVHAGELYVSASKSGYQNLYKHVEVKAGETVDVELDGYLPRYAQVWWEYEAEEGRTFTNQRLSGTAVLGPRKLRRVMFGKELVNVGGKSDFAVRQKGEKLLIGHFDMRGPKLPGHIHYDDRSLEQITEAPERGYQDDWDELKKGDVYVFHTYDGKHYAKLEVLEVTTKEPEE